MRQDKKMLSWAAFNFRGQIKILMIVLWWNWINNWAIRDSSLFTDVRSTREEYFRRSWSLSMLNNVKVATCKWYEFSLEEEDRRRRRKKKKVDVKKIKWGERLFRYLFHQRDGWIRKRSWWWYSQQNMPLASLIWGRKWKMNEDVESKIKRKKATMIGMDNCLSLPLDLQIYFTRSFVCKCVCVNNQAKCDLNLLYWES